MASEQSNIVEQYKELVTSYSSEKNKVKGTEHFRYKTKELADLLAKELDNILENPTEEGISVVGTIIEDASGDVVLKSFHLQTLRMLANRYIGNQNFQWFINSTHPTLASVGLNNPLLLESMMFSSTSLEFSADAAKPFELTDAEKAAAQTVAGSDVGLMFLVRRNWLVVYLLALQYFRIHHSLGDYRKKLVTTQKSVSDAKVIEAARKSAQRELEETPTDSPISIPFQTGFGLADQILPLNNLGA